MAIRTNTIEYGWETELTDVQSGSMTPSTVKTIYIPETSSRVFTSVVMCMGNRIGLSANTVAAACSMSVQIDNNPTSSFHIIPQATNLTTEHVAYQLYVPITSYFNTYFTSSVHQVRFHNRPIFETINGRTFKLICTYQCEDENITTAIKTVRLPINSVTSSTLGTSEVYLGNYTASIPAFDSYLPEVSKSYRDIFVEYHANDAGSGTTNFQLRTRIDNATSASRFVVSQSFQSAAYYYDLQTLSGSIDTSTTHSIRVASTVASRFTGLCGILYCTYEYNYTGSTNVLNSLILPVENADSFTVVRISGMPSSSFEQAYKKASVYIPESDVQLRRSAVMLSHVGSVLSTHNISINSASYTAYVLKAGTLQTGAVPIMHQIDGTGSSNTNSIVLSSGWNNIKIFGYKTSTTTDAHAGMLLYLNYTSSVDAQTRPGSNNHTVLELVSGSFLPGSSVISTNYWFYPYSMSLADRPINIVGCANQYHYLSGKSSNTPIFSSKKQVIYYTGSDYSFDSNVTNPVSCGEIDYITDARIDMFNIYADLYPVVKKTTLQSSIRSEMDLRQYHLFGTRDINSVAAQSVLSHLLWITYNTKQYSITGSIANYSGSGIIPISVYDYDSGIKLFNTSSKSGGVIDTYWYDRHTNLMLIAETGSRYISNILPANSGSFLITIPTSSVTVASGEKSFTFIG
jgi:hypothetical protein